MPHLTTNPLDWAYDDVLTEEIFKALEQDTGPSFVFTVSVQPHGPIPRRSSTPTRASPDRGGERGRQNGLEYYINQL